jgi:hypothetical protein
MLRVHTFHFRTKTFASVELIFCDDFDASENVGHRYGALGIPAACALHPHSVV